METWAVSSRAIALGVARSSMRFLAYVSAFTVASALALSAGAQNQGSIRVESNRVLVSVWVWNQQRWNGIIQTDHTVLEHDLAAGDLHRWQGIVIPGLTASNFRVFEDEKEQVINSVGVEAPRLSDIRDNVSEHYELMGTAGGRWIHPDFPNNVKPYPMLPAPAYLLSYSPPQSAVGSCHRVAVKVIGVSDADHYGDFEYCRTPFAESDPLAGTRFGKKIRVQLASLKSGKIDLALTASTLFFREGESSYVHFAIEFPARALQFEWEEGNPIATIGMAGAAYSADGTEVTRFSEFDCCDDSTALGVMFLLPWSLHPEILSTPKAYEREIELPPGEYELLVVLSDDHNFGRTRVHVSVPTLDAQHIDLSDIALAKRFRPASPPPRDSTFQSPSTYIPLVSKGVEYTPTADTTFTKSDAFLFFLQLYDPLISTASACSQPAPAPQTSQPIGSSATTSGASTGAASASPAAADSAVPTQCLPRAQINLRIVDAKTGAVVRNLAPLNAADFAIPGNPIIPIGSGVYIDDLPTGQYRLEARATTLPIAAAPGSVSLSKPPPPPQTTPWHSVSFSIQ